jgi:hypothetical protein
MSSCTAVDVAQIVTAIFTGITGLAAVAAVIVTGLQGRATAVVNRATLEGLQQESERRADERREREQERAYHAWLSEHLANVAETPTQTMESFAPEELQFVQRAIREGYLVPYSRSSDRALTWRAHRG